MQKIMKKNQLITLFFLAIFIFSPLITHGATMEVTVTINSLQIPERSTVLLLNDRPNSEFLIGSSVTEKGSRLLILDKNNNLIAKPFLIEAPSFNYGHIFKGSYAVASFTYLAESAPYNAYLEIRVYKQYEGETSFNADCSTYTVATGGTAWYYNYISYQNDDGYKNYASKNCPDYNCDGCYDYRDQILFNPASVRGYNYAVDTIVCGSGGPSACLSVGTDSGVSFYFFRSPTIATF